MAGDMKEAVPTLTFNAGEPGIHPHLETLINTRMLVQANSGGGKSRALRALLEGTHGQVQQFVLDPEGEFGSLREEFEYVLAGEEGDVPAEPQSARVLCRRLMELGASAVINLYDLSLENRRVFVRLFLEELMSLPRSLWRPLLVVIDEAHSYCPERGTGQAESTDAVKTLCSQGRKRGFCAVLATQRLSKLHKDAAAELLNKLIGRTGLDVDVKRAADDLGFSKEESLQLKRLQPGEFFAYGPAIATEVLKVQTGDVLTSHPKAGAIGAPPPPPSGAIQQLIAKMQDIPSQAAEELRTVEELRARIAELEREAKSRPAERVEVRVEVPVPVLADGELERLEEVGHAAIAGAKDLHQIGADILATLAQITAPKAPPPAPVAPQLSPGTIGAKPAPFRAKPAPISPKAPAPNRSAGVALPTAQRKVLTVLAQHGPRSKTQIALLTGYSSNGGGFNNSLSALRSAGFIHGGKEQMAITSQGVDALGDWQPLPTGRALLDYWVNELSKAEGLILRYLVDVSPRSKSKEDVASHTGYEPTGGGFNNALSRLRTLELISGGKEAMRASDVFFDEGR